MQHWRLTAFNLAAAGFSWFSAHGSSLALPLFISVLGASAPCVQACSHMFAMHRHPELVSHKKSMHCLVFICARKTNITPFHRHVFVSQTEDVTLRWRKKKNFSLATILKLEGRTKKTKTGHKMRNWKWSRVWQFCRAGYFCYSWELNCVETWRHCFILCFGSVICKSYFKTLPYWHQCQCRNCITHGVALL